RSIAQMLKIPYVFVAYCPAVLPAPDHPPLPKRGLRYPQWLPSIVNRVLWKIDDRFVDLLFLATLNEERAKIGLAPVGSVQRHVDLERFLANGEPPVYLGFGSMRAGTSRAPAEALQHTGRMLIEAARTAGLRAIISQGWGNLSLVDSGADCISIGDVDHERLFARSAAVVHL